jgi:hypothetical protein
MSDTLSRLMTPPGTSSRGGPPMPVGRDDPAIDEAGRKRRAAAALRMGMGQTRLTPGLGDTSAGSQKPRLLGEVG